MSGFYEQETETIQGSCSDFRILQYMARLRHTKVVTIERCGLPSQEIWPVSLALGVITDASNDAHTVCSGSCNLSDETN